MKKRKIGQKYPDTDHCFTCPMFSYEETNKGKKRDDREFKGVARCQKYQDEIYYKSKSELGRLICDEA